MSLDALAKEFAKKGYLVKKASEMVEEPKISTGVFSLDWVLDGGVAQCEGGHRIELWGSESSGKSTLALFIIKAFQKLGKTCVYIDAEESYDKTWAEMIGVDNSNLLILKPNTLEEFGDQIAPLILDTDLIVIDSIVTLIPEEEVDRDTNQPTMALQARINSLISRKMYSSLSKRKTCLIFINQMREAVGKFSPAGTPKTSAGGHALLHLYNSRVEIKKGKPIDVSNERIGWEVHLKGIKNKKGIANRTAEFDFYNDGRIDNKKTIFFAALKYSVVELNGKTYTYKKKSIVGKDAFLEEFDDWKTLEKEVWAEIEKGKR